VEGSLADCRYHRAVWSAVVFEVCYDPKQTVEERHAFENLILLCNRHSKVADSEPRKYSVELLQDMKEMHERNRLFELSPSDARKAELLLKDYREIYIRAGGM
jgi:hypothetical protein